MNKKSFILIIASTVIFISCSNDSQIGKQVDIEGKVIATVNGVKIKKPELTVLTQANQSAGKSISSDEGIEELINIELLRQQAIAEKLHLKDEIAAEMNRQSIQVLATTVVQNRLKKELITEQDLLTEYTNQVTNLPKNEYYVYHIVSKSKIEAENNIDDLNNGASFSELAKKRSLDSSGEKGGSIGWVNPNNFAKTFSQALLHLDTGKYTKTPIQTNSGWHVIFLEKTRPYNPPEFETVRSNIKTFLANKRIKEFVNSLRKQAKIEIVNTTESPEN